MQALTPSPAYTGPLYFVRSDAHPTRYYAVGVDPRTDLYVCECPDHMNRARDCKHIRRVQAGTITPAASKTTPPPPLSTAARPSTKGRRIQMGMEV